MSDKIKKAVETASEYIFIWNLIFIVLALVVYILFVFDIYHFYVGLYTMLVLISFMIFNALAIIGNATIIVENILSKKDFFKNLQLMTFLFIPMIIGYIFVYLTSEMIV